MKADFMAYLISAMSDKGLPKRDQALEATLLLPQNPPF